HVHGDPAGWADCEAQCQLLRCLVGPLPFRPPPRVVPAVLQWNGGTVVHLAQAAYEERELPRGQLDRQRLAVLAGALEEAGGSRPTGCPPPRPRPPRSRLLERRSTPRKVLNRTRSDRMTMPVSRTASPRCRPASTWRSRSTESQHPTRLEPAEAVYVRCHTEE